MVFKLLEFRRTLSVLGSLSLVVLCLVAGSPDALRAEEAEAEAVSELPRYRFKAGQELVYEQTSKEDLLAEAEAEGEKPIARQDEIKWTVWVTKQNDDGSWRLLIRKQIKLLDIPVEGEPTVRFENDFLGNCNMHPDGSFIANPSLGENYIFETLPEELFVQLPKEASEMASGWEFVSPVDRARYNLQAFGGDGNVLQIGGPVVFVLDTNYEETSAREIEFDTLQCLPTKIVWDRKSDRQSHLSHTRTTVEQTASNTRDSKWIAQLDQEAAQYFAASEMAWGRLAMAARARSKQACQETVDETHRRLIEARERADIPEIQQLFVALLTVQDREAEWAIEAAAAREEFYAKPPIPWETTDLADTPRRLADYRGKVVLMDFWNRGCGHCILALPKVKQLAAKYGDKNVVVLGINNDPEDADAQHVIDVYEISYPTLRAGQIPRQYFVDTWPTFIVLDQNGRIAEFIEGNVEDLVERVSTMVDQLLANPPEDDQFRASSDLPTE